MPPARHSAGYGRGLLGVAVIYVGLYGALLGVTRGIPYVTDGNESFSMLIHASNLYHFPISQTFGLADEALSLDPAAHPYVYTHQGNFPRVFAFILYALGARTVESQIVITTFTIGALAVFLLYHYFATVATPLFAFIAAAVALTDYLFFTQWQVNTFRVWHGFFLYLALWCVHGTGRLGRRRWLALTVVAYASMFYFELVFATFVAVMAGLYAAVWHWKRPSLLFRCWTAQVAGAVVGVLTLVGQLIGYLGWTDFLEDLRITYSARNLLTADPAYLDRVREFVETRRLVFWYNFASVDYQRSAHEVLSAITGGYFTAYTPALWYLVVILLTGWLLGFFRRPDSASPAVVVPEDAGARTSLGMGVSAVLLLVAWTRFLLAVVRPDALAGVAGSRLSFEIEVETWIVAPAVLLAAGLTASMVRLVTGQWSGLRRLPVVPTLLAAVFLLLSEHLVLSGATLFDSFYALLWEQVQGRAFPGGVFQLALIVASGVAVLMLFNTPVASEARWPLLVAYLSCGCTAFVIVYYLSPGYVHSGYLDRLVAFFSLVLETAIAVVLYIFIRIAGRLMTLVRAAFATSTPISERVGLSLAAGVAASLLVVATSYWMNLQTTYTRLLPPTHFGFMKQLGDEPFRGASFAANTYAAPIYAYTGQWAYFDTRLGLQDGGAVSPGENGTVVDRDARTYLWLADRESNREYERPEYFLCVTYQDLRTIVYRRRNVPLGCSTGGVVRQAIHRDKPSVGDVLVGRDPVNDSWAIVKLNWSALDRPLVLSEARLE